MEPEMEIKSLKETDFGTICRAFGKAFADYELQLNDTQLQAMLTRRGYLPELSFGAFDGDELVAFTLNGIGTFHDIATAYDTGTGTLPDYRGQGLATKIFEYSIPFLRAADIRHKIIICEPLLERIDLAPYNIGQWVEQVVAGGESGNEARPCGTVPLADRP